MPKAIPLDQLEPGRVCLLKPSSLGDVVHALPTLAALRTRWPNAQIAWVVNRGLRGLLDGHPDLDEVIPFDRARAKFTPGGIGASARFLADLRARRFDLAIDLQGLLRSGIMAFATGATTRVGLADAREGASRFYTDSIDTRPASHAVDRLLVVASAFGADVSRPRFVVACGEAERGWARSTLAGVNSPTLVVNLGARWLTKRWPPEHFAEVARRASVSRGAGLIAVGAPEDRPLVEAFAARLGPMIPVRDLCGRTTLPQLAAIAGASDLFLSNDTGPLHLAAAAGARTVGVYTCTSPRLTGPYGSRSIPVASAVWCASSCVRSCDRLECMAELSPERVWEAVARGLDGASQSGADAA